MRRKINSIISRFKRPFENKKAFSALDLILAMVATMLLASIIIYSMASLEQEWVKGGLNSEANAMVDVIAENRQINDNINAYFQDNLKGYSFYMSDYKIVYTVYNADSTGISEAAIITADKGGNSGNFTLKKGQLVKVYIQSTNETFLTKATKFVGGNVTTDVIGFAEGGVD